MVATYHPCRCSARSVRNDPVFCLQILEGVPRLVKRNRFGEPLGFWGFLNDLMQGGRAGYIIDEQSTGTDITEEEWDRAVKAMYRADEERRDAEAIRDSSSEAQAHSATNSEK